MISLAIDASVNNVGWSLFDSEGGSMKEAWTWGTFHPTGDNLHMRIQETLQHLQTDVLFEHTSRYIPDFLITEKPAFYSSERGKIAAHMNYTIDLAAINYFIAGWMHMDHRYHYAITATQWKGSVPKQVTARKFFRTFGQVDTSTLSEHAIDATMLHYFWIEKYAIRLPPALLDTPPESLLKLTSLAHKPDASAPRGGRTSKRRSSKRSG